MAINNPVHLGDIIVDWNWLVSLGWSANRSLKYRDWTNSKYKIKPEEHDYIWYAIRWWWVGPLQGKWDYVVKRIDENRWEATDSNGDTIRIPDKYEYYNEKGFLKTFDNGESIRNRAIDYWNSNDKNRYKWVPKRDINVDGANNINREWRKLLTEDIDRRVADLITKKPFTETEARKIVRPAAIAAFVYPYKDAQWNNVMKASQVISRKWSTIPTMNWRRIVK